MKTSSKKFLSLVLAVLTLVSCFVPALAAGGSGLPALSGEDCQCPIDTLTKYEGKPVEATCDKWGYTIYECKTHGYVGREWVAPKPHTPGEPVIEGTCDTAVTVIRCTECNAVIGDKVPVENGAHTFSDEFWATYDCTKTYTGADAPKCSVCKENIDITPAATAAHKYTYAGNHTEVGQGTCSNTLNGHSCTATKEGDKIPHEFTASVVVYPTCAVDGEMKYECTCGDSYKVVIKATGKHDYSISVDKKDPTCTEEGYTAHKKCSVCEDENSDYSVLEKIPHDFSVEVGAQTATCTEKGWDAYKECSRCQAKPDTYTEYAPLNHTLPNGKPAWELESLGHCAKEDADAVASVYKCSLCKATKEEAVPHVMETNTARSFRPTCTEFGMDVRYCKNCGKNESVMLDPLGHLTPEKGAVLEGADPAECEEDGHTGGYVCGRVVNGKKCNVIVGEEGTTLDRFHKVLEDAKVPFTATTIANTTFVIVAATEPNCTEEGCIDHIKCTVCDKTYVWNETDSKYEEKDVSIDTVPGKHVWGEVEPVEGKEATCSYGGEITQLCTKCDAVNTEDGYPKYSDEIDPDNHVWKTDVDGNIVWNITKPATCFATGEKVMICTLCTAMEGTDGAEFDEVPMLVHQADPAYTAVEVSAATCTSNGKILYTCIHHADDKTIHTFVSEYAIDATTGEFVKNPDGTYVYALPAINHANASATVNAKPATCTTDGNAAKVVCPDCKKVDPFGVGDDGRKIDKHHKVLEDATAAFTANKGKFVVYAAQAADCLNKGNIAYIKCTGDCGGYFVWKDTKYVAAEYAEDPDLTADDGKIYIILKETGHTEVDIPVIPNHCPTAPGTTCTVCGLADCKGLSSGTVTQGKMCSVCETVTVTPDVEVDANPTDVNKNHIGWDDGTVDSSCWKAGYTYWTCTVEGCYANKHNKVDDIELKEHDKTYIAEDVDRTCTTDGYVVNYCETCYKASLTEADFPFCDGVQTAWDFALKNDNETRAWIYIDNFEKAEGHYSMVDKDGDGTPEFKLEIADDQTTIDCTDEDLANKKTDWTVADLTCDNCTKAIEIAHEPNAEPKRFVATCERPAYEMFICRDCETEQVTILNNGELDPDNHAQKYKISETSETIFSAATITWGCRLCPEYEEVETLPVSAAYAFTVRLEVFNPLKDGDAFVKSGMLGVRVILTAAEGYEIDVTSAQIEFAVSDDLKYVGNKFVVDGYDYANIKAACANSICKFTFNATPDANKNIVPMTLSGETAIAELYFMIGDNDDTLDLTTDLRDVTVFKPSSVEVSSDEFVTGSNLEYKKYSVKVADDAEDITNAVALLGDGNGDGELTHVDVQRLLNLIRLGEYETALDIDKDGVLTIFDLGLLQDRVVGEIADDYIFYNKGIENGTIIVKNDDDTVKYTFTVKEEYLWNA